MQYQRILTALAVTRSLPFASLVSADGDTLMRAQINAQDVAPRLPDGLIPHVVEGVPTLISPGDTQLVGAIVKLRGYDNIYLFVARPVNPEVLEFMRLTDDNVTEYRQYASNRLVFQITFTIMYLGLALVLLLAALWIGIALANRFVDPIRNLMIASSRVSEGDLDVQVPVQPGRGDLRDLSNRFNTMTRQLRTQRVALVQANETNEKRRQFTEAVVEGVSAGIVGLDAFGAITLFNARAVGDARARRNFGHRPAGRRGRAGARADRRAGEIVAARPDPRPDRDRLGPRLPHLPGAADARRHDGREQGLSS